MANSDFKLNRGLILAIKRQYDHSHCDVCRTTLTGRDVVSVPELGKLRCERCTHSLPSAAE
jgi:hypothetical protein